MRWLRRILRRLCSLAAAATLTFVALTVTQVLLARFVTPPLTLTMVERVVEHAKQTGELQWVRYSPRSWPMDHPAARAVVASEDGRFFAHRGFDWQAICLAVEEAQGGGRLRGASTISQQVARNLFLWQGRSWVRKSLEAWYTLWLEWLVPKHRILELYLDVAETGPMTFGFEAGAELWYGRGADDASEEELARIAGILPSPNRWRPDGEQARRRARFIRTNPAPFPGDRGFDRFAEQVSGVGAWDCAQGMLRR